MQNDPFVSLPKEPKKSLPGDLLRSIVIGLLVMSAGFILLGLLVFHELTFRALVFGGSAALVCACVLWLVHRQKLQLAGIILVVFLWLIVSVGSYTGGGLNAPIFLGYAAVILIGALTFGNRNGLYIFLLTVVFAVFLAYAEVNQFLPDLVSYSPASRLFINSFFLFLILLLQRTAVNTTKDAISRAQLSEIQYRSFLENISIVTYINDISLDSRSTYVSPQVKGMLGYSSEDFLNNQTLWTELVFPEDREAVLLENIRTSETGEPFVMEYRLVARNQELVWVRDEATLIRDEGGKPQYWLGTWTDVTERKNSEYAQMDAVGALMRRTHQLQTASEVSSAATSILELNELLPKVVELIRAQFDYYYVGIFLADENHEMVTLRAATGETGRRMLASRHSLLIGSSSMVGWCVANNQARIALDVGEDAVRFKNPILPLTRSELALPLRARGQVIGAMTIQSDRAAAFTDADITALQTMTDQVANAIETARLFDERSHLIRELENKNAELERFSYTVSHDLKSPLVTIRGFMGYLREDARRGDLTRFDKDLERVIKATETMQNLLNDLLELSRVGRIIKPLEDVAFGEIVQEALNLIVNPLHPGDVKIEVQENFPVVHCDRTRIIEVIQNLLSNSIKFMGDQPQPQIQIGSLDVDAQPDYSTFFIKDNGVGIEPQYHDRVFGLFNRLDPEQDGTGIGLTLVKRIIEVHGGLIWLESEGQNKGTTFYFTLPTSQVLEK